ncbi:conjugal transfer protein TraB [Neorhizobium sp. NCHU2750]|uniref:conjugal transfer protein TraB n=1 Tax=Neorhizobium sp. NCHU2750 TaxID=1825976 RepID=UPI000E75BB37|nr:conjugal transfer protein [Neorhizobium sp. NCHU2750]
MRRDRLRLTGLVGIAALCGWMGWNGDVLLLPLSILFPALWSGARTRWQAAFISAGYFLAAAHGLPQGVANFYSAEVWPGLLLWMAASSIFICVHAFCWANATVKDRSLRYLGACAVMAVPPAGILGWANPVTAAGVLFPGWGWAGLGATLIGLALMATSYRPFVAMIMCGFWIWSATHWTPAISPSGWQSIDLQFGASLGREGSLQREQELVSMARRHSSGTVVIFPESTLGFWTPTSRHFWQKSLEETNVTVIAGAAVVDQSGYDNVLVRITAMSSSIIYRERMPVPGAMWQPWRRLMDDAGGARAHLFTNPVVSLSSTRLAPLICYEQLLVWPILQSMLHDPDIIVAVGNGWWTAGTSIVAIQRATTRAWALLFNIPFVLSFNT